MVIGLVLLCSAAATAQPRPYPVHFQHAGLMPPGAIGNLRLRQGGPLSGYIQPVEIRTPQGVRISLALGGAFDQPQATPALVGMYVAPVYRLRVTNIPNHAGQEVYPTVEIIDRLYPPAGKELQFPVPVEITREELNLALSGKMVTKVIYVENPAEAFPLAEVNGKQRYHEVQPGQSPIEVADALGRPIAILRLGGRVPGPEGPDARFLYGSPPIVRLPRDNAPADKKNPEKVNP